jgi:hypothetical protein
MIEYNTVSTMGQTEIDFLDKQLENANKFLEFGSGASTLMALRNANISVVSIDTSQDYVKYLSEEIKILGLPIENVMFLVVDIGPTGWWGRPLDNSCAVKFPDYSRVPFEEIESMNFTPDLVLIDGRFRVATFLNTILHCPQSTIIFDDYFDRPQYFEVESILKPSDQCGRLAVFQSPNELDISQLRKCFDLIQKTLLDAD